MNVQQRCVLREAIKSDSHFKDVTLAMDLSLSSPGFAVLAVYEGKPIILDKTFVKTRVSKGHGYRMQQIADVIQRLLSEYKPEHLVREKGFSRFAATTQALFKIVGLSDYLANQYQEDMRVTEIAPTSVKKAVTGDGKASKEDVAFAVHSILQLEDPDYFDNDDESDAAGVGIAFLKQKGLIE